MTNDRMTNGGVDAVGRRGRGVEGNVGGFCASEMPIFGLGQASDDPPMLCAGSAKLAQIYPPSRNLTDLPTFLLN